MYRSSSSYLFKRYPYYGAEYPSNSLDFKMVRTQVNEKRYYNSIRFPLNVKYFHVEEFFAHKNDNLYVATYQKYTIESHIC